jgi:hypothetical protein
LGKLGLENAVTSLQQAGLSIDENFAAYVDGLTGLWIPPASGTEVTRWISPHVMDPRVDEACRILGIEDLGNYPEVVRSLWYPVTDELNKVLSEGGDPDFVPQGGPLAPDPPLPPRTSGPTGGLQQALIDKGWRYKKPDTIDHQRLVRDFLRLSDPSDLEDEVRKFVLKWGPLWLCAKHTDCYWTPHSYSNDDSLRSPGCRWFCCEPAILFKAKARQAEAAIVIAGYLAKKENAAVESWSELTAGLVPRKARFVAGHKITEHVLSVQQANLMWVVNRFIGNIQGPKFRLFWSPREGRPKMLIDTGLGFLRLAWLQIAQNLSGMKGIYKCDACAGYYIAERKPPDGRHHFCPSCGGARKLGSKKLWARSNRKT